MLHGFNIFFYVKGTGKQIRVDTNIAGDSQRVITRGKHVRSCRRLELEQQQSFYFQQHNDSTHSQTYIFMLEWPNQNPYLNLTENQLKDLEVAVQTLSN